MKKVLLVLCMFVAASLMFPEVSPQWIRWAAISPDGERIVFSSHGDLYLVSGSGGDARILTIHEADEYHPVWSPDGEQIAFASDRHGNLDVFVVAAAGGEAVRLTRHSADEVPYAFTADGKQVLFGAARLDDFKHRGFPTTYLPELYQVPANGGRVEQVWTFPAEEVQVSPDGSRMIYIDKKGGENYWRKHHRSAVTRDIWLYDKAKNHHMRLTTSPFEDRNPVFAPDQKSIYYLSEESGSFNVHRLELAQPQKNEAVTVFSGHPVRFLSIDNQGTLCFTHHGDLYVQKPGAEPKKLMVRVVVSSKENDGRLIPVQGKVSEMAVSPDGKEMAYVVRGEVFATSTERKMVRRITTTPGAERFVSFTPDGKGIVYAGERNGRWGIYRARLSDPQEKFFHAATILEEEALLVTEADNYMPLISPDGKSMAFIENKRELKVMDLKSKETRTLLSANNLVYMGDGDQYFQWSPDSRWLLAEYTPRLANTEVVLLKADGSQEMVNLTESGYHDMRPSWAGKGELMLWFSNRHGLRAYANSGARQRDVYGLYFTRKAWERANLSKDEFGLFTELEEKDKGDEEKSDKKDKKKKEKPEETIQPLRFEWEGMRERRKRLTIHSSFLGDAVLSKDGETLYYLARFEKGMNLWATKLRSRETEKILDLGARSGQLQRNAESESLFLLADGNIFKLDPEKKSKKPVHVGGEITFDETAERKEMFGHVWEKTRSMFYESGFHGVDWEAMKIAYAPKLAGIGNDREFVELLSEMLGELNVSHCGARAMAQNPHADETASLGIFIDTNYSGEGIRITEVMRNGPLDRAGFNVKPGMVITAINGIAVSSETDSARYLNRLAEKRTALSLLDPGTGKTTDLVVIPISSKEERTLLYERWVRLNEQEVEKSGNGRLGYVHIPGMSDGSYRHVYDKAMGKYFDREGLIVDTRFNGGGDLVGDITMFLSGERFMTYAIEQRDLGYEPNYRWTRPHVALVNEANYSDGHCFACAYKDLGIGKLVGMPVPGTCSFAGWEMLQNGTILWGTIPVSARNKAGEWLENNQTEPDVMVKNIPGFVDRGRDQQLEAAIRVLLDVIDK
ncbi:MAG TPA: peptidase S41 [Candidatus Aminicenantes bacterium]|nr:peptidase S41 [Candidatus Aminicenantes bacterium]